jgi:hypothetical protein
LSELNAFFVKYHLSRGIGLSAILPTSPLITVLIIVSYDTTGFWLVDTTMCPVAMMMIINVVGSGALPGIQSYLYL